MGVGHCHNSPLLIKKLNDEKKKGNVTVTQTKVEVGVD